MPMISEGWSEALLPAIYEYFHIGFNRRQSMIPMLFDVRGSDRAYEELIGIGEAGTDAWDTYEKSGQVGEISYDQGYKTTFTHVTYPVTFNIKREWLEDVQYTAVKDYVRKIGVSAFNHREDKAASVFNNAFSGSFTGGDGVSLCSSAHPLSPIKSGTTQDNSGTTDLGKAAVSATKILMEKFEDDSGNRLTVIPDLLIVPVDLQDVAKEITDSVYDPDSANNAVNPQQMQFSYLKWNKLTDTNNWFMADSVWMKESLIWYDRVPLEFMNVREDAVNIQIQARMRYSYGWSDWRWVYGHVVA